MIISTCLHWTASGGRHGAHRAAWLAVLASLLLCWGCGGIGRVTRQPTSDPASRMKMSRADADQVDDWLNVEWQLSLGTAQEKCDFWNRKRNEAPAKLPDARRYAEVKAEYECKEAAEWAAEERRREAERVEKEKAAAVVAAQEIAANQCEAGNRELLERWMFFIKDAMVLRFNADGTPKTFAFVDKMQVVTNPDGVALTLGDYLGGELHIFAFSSLPLTLEVSQADGQAATLASPWAKQIKWRCSITGECISGDINDPPRPAYDDSKMVMAGSGESLTLRVRGQGCSLVMVFRGL